MCGSIKPDQSEDVDFKIQLKKTDVNLNKTQLLKELKKFRSQIKSNLSLPGLITGEPVVRNEGRYSRIELNYSSFFSAGTALRPHILLEFTLSNIRLAVDSLSIRTIIEDHLKNVNLFASSSTLCVSVNETAIEKWVALTRRIIAIDRAYHADDKTLIRHIYDLNAIKCADKIHANFFILAKAIVSNDSRQFKKQHPEYASNPEAEIRQSLSLLKNKPIWKERYQEFIDTMVYDKATTLEYENVLAGIEHLSEIAINSLNTEG
ncbi:MAG: nucleotidyl transferase AbiEii/AbiGii toxin family protein [Legionella sp.]|nr:nucleotidyl transferase AbiEii/AbiGii toxin family protein [Legionella sp.]